MDCSKTEVFFAEWKRMCRSYHTIEQAKEECKIHHIVENCRDCMDFVKSETSLAIKIVQEWSDSHPVKTRLSVLKEAFPNAKYCEDGQPEACAGDLFGISCPIYEKDYIADNECVKCWNTPIEGVQ